MADGVGKSGSTRALEEIVEETMRPGKNLFVYPPNMEASYNLINMLPVEAPSTRMLMYQRRALPSTLI